MKNIKDEVLVPMTIEQHEWYKKNIKERDKEISNIRHEYESQIHQLNQELRRAYSIASLNNTDERLSIYINYDKNEYSFDSDLYFYIENILINYPHYNIKYLPYDFNLEGTQQYKMFSKMKRDISDDIISKIGEDPYNNYKKLDKIPKWIRKIFNAI